MSDRSDWHRQTKAALRPPQSTSLGLPASRRTVATSAEESQRFEYSADSFQVKEIVLGDRHPLRGRIFLKVLCFQLIAYLNVRLLFHTLSGPFVNFQEVGEVRNLKTFPR